MFPSKYYGKFYMFISRSLIFELSIFGNQINTFSKYSLAQTFQIQPTPRGESLKITQTHLFSAETFHGSSGFLLRNSLSSIKSVMSGLRCPPLLYLLKIRTISSRQPKHFGFKHRGLYLLYYI